MKILLVLWLFILPACTLLNKQKQQEIKALKKPSLSQKKISFEENILEEKTVDEARKQLAKGLLLTKSQVKSLKKVLQSQKAPELRDPARMILARHFFKKKSYKIALSYYSKVKEKPYKNKAQLLSAKIYERQGLRQKAWDLLEVLLEEEELSPPQLKEAYTLKLSILLKDPLSDKQELLKSYCQILSQESQQNPLYRKKSPPTDFSNE